MLSRVCVCGAASCALGWERGEAAAVGLGRQCRVSLCRFAEHLLRTPSTSRPAALPRVPAMETAKAISGNHVPPPSRGFWGLGDGAAAFSETQPASQAF